MRQSLARIILIIILLNNHHAKASHSLREEIKNKLIARFSGTVSGKITTIQDSLYSPNYSKYFYSRNDYSPAWLGEKGILPDADSLLLLLREARFEGLDPYDYHYINLQTLMNDSSLKYGPNENNRDRFTDLDMLLTDAWYTYASHLYAGRSGRNSKKAERLKEVNLTDSLFKAKKTSLRKVLSNLSNPNAQYSGLKRALERYYIASLTGGWPPLPADSCLEPGDSGMLVRYLKLALKISGDYTVSDTTDIFNKSLQKALMKFQKANAIYVSGIADRSTINAINVPVEERMRILSENMERWRWIPRKREDPYILVDITAFRLQVIEEEKPVLEMKIIVGKPYNQTPMVQSRISYLTLNPWWEVPVSIAKKELLVDLQRDPKYLDKNHMLAYKGWDTISVIPDSIDWDKVTEKNFNYRFRQSPGPWNALGQIKFFFPNEHQVYLHDTPNKGLFSREVRNFSHGCIRIEKPLDLATYLLKKDEKDTAWSKEKVQALLDSKEEKLLYLPKSVDVFVCYWTCWVSREGLVEYRKDIYAVDRRPF